MLDYTPEDFYHEIYFHSNDRFEEVRKICLSEGNWLGRNFEKDRLKIEDHNGFSVVYHKETHEPVVMGGIYNNGLYPANIARHLHRYYSFPKWRGMTRTQLRKGWAVTKTHIIDPLDRINNFDLYFAAMQTREKRPSLGYWKIWYETMTEVCPDWKPHNDLIQTCKFNVRQCWQNFVYNEVKSGTFKEWNPETVTQDQWIQLPLGTK